MTNLRAARLYACVVCLLLGSAASGREVEDFNAGWRFAKGEQPEGASPTLADGNWQAVRLPHDWAIAGPFDPEAPGDTGKLPWRGEGWYRKRFNLPADAAGRRVYLRFDGVMAEPKVWINGKQAGGWDYGYNSFWVDATPHIKPGGSNLVAVHADTRRLASRWYPGAGIYRKVELHVTEQVHVAPWGLDVRTPRVEAKSATALVRCRVENHGAQPREALIALSLNGPDGQTIEQAEPQKQEIPARGSVVVEHEFKVANPRLWSPDSPSLYTARVVVSSEATPPDEAPVDERSIPCGFRKVEFTPNYGMYLNGRRLAIKGVNLHHGLGPLGAAFSKPLMRRRLRMMKQMGANAVRTSHNPAAPELLDLCDEMGLLVFNELFDKWDATASLHNDGGFDKFVRRQVSSFVRRDRNHPCVVVWSIGNEIADVLRNPTEKNQRRVELLVKEFKRYDPTRPVTMGCNIVNALDDGLLDSLDVQSWNYGRKYARAKGRYPKTPTIYSESASTLSTRGHYVLPLAENKLDYGKQDDADEANDAEKEGNAKQTGSRQRQLGSHDRNAAPWSDIPDVEFERMQRDQYCAGEFVWTGYDYLGEPTPFNDAWSQKVGGDFTRSARSSYFGIVDLCGLPKDRYYLYRSHWAPKKTTIHILPHWNWEPGQRVPVYVYTSGDEAELLLNGKSLGKQKKDPRASFDPSNYYGVMRRYRLVWEDVEFEPGELTVVAYRKGKEIGTATTRTAGEPHAVRLTVEAKRLVGDGVDLCEVLVEVVDSEGVVCPKRGDMVRFQVAGPAEIAGIGNGDPTSYDPFGDAQHPVFAGKGVLLLRSVAGQSGEARLIGSAEGLKPGSIKVRVDRPSSPEAKP